MKTFKTMMFAAAAATFAVPAAAQVGGIAVADPNNAVARSRAWTTAQSQIQATYKAQIDQAEARRKAITAEIQPLYTKFEADRKANVAEATLRQQATAIQQKETAGNQELARLTQPAQRAQAYALEQIQRQLNAAVTAATQRKNVTLLLRPDAALFAQPAADITADVTAELDRLVPSVNTTPPANWQPGQDGAGAAPAASAAPAAAAPAATAPRRQQQGR